MLETLEQRKPEMLDASPIQTDFNENQADVTISRLLRTESWQKRISNMGWLSTSIVHDLRNPLGTVFAGAEMLMQLDPASTQGKRLAANIYRAAIRMRELLADLAGASTGNESIRERDGARRLYRDEEVTCFLYTASIAAWAHFSPSAPDTPNRPYDLAI
jgi:hypothetical protein